MPDKESIIYEDPKYLKNRLAELKAFFGRSAIEELDIEKIGGLFRLLLMSQEEDGSWVDPAGVWTGVQTALVLKALALLGYNIKSSWPIIRDNKRWRGGIQNAFDFFSKKEIKLHPNNIPNHFIEDIWDACQVLLAYAFYDKQNEYRDVVSDFKVNWKTIYRELLKNKKIDWRGPAFLAAMLDVFVVYDIEEERIEEVIKVLLEIGKVGEKDYSGFLWRDSKAEPCWHGALILRTLARLPNYLINIKTKSDIVNSLTKALLDERVDSNGSKSSYWGEKAIDQHVPMYTARVLEGLIAGLPYLDEDIIKTASEAIEQANQFIFSEIRPDRNYQIYTPKTTITVAEYIASITSAVPVGVLIDATECLTKQLEINDLSSMKAGYDYVEKVKDGLRVIWLSDLHIGKVKKSGALFALKETGPVRRLFSPRKHLWSESFASENLRYMQDRIGELKPDHILVTGDITNLALRNQFQKAREHFLMIQERADKSATDLLHNFWTILPGNHDVDRKFLGTGLFGFSDAFKVTYNNGHNNPSFPFRKTLESRASKFKLEIIGMNSTPDWPVEVVGMNARGKLGKEQKDRLGEFLEDVPRTGKFVVVALHHAPLSVPHIRSEWAEYFMALDGKDAVDLINLCCTFEVKGILHGHYHTYSPWYAPVVNSKKVAKQMPIIGAPCGTTGIPGQNVEFLELREVNVMIYETIKPGLSVIRHRRVSESEKEWDEEDLGIVIY